MRRVAIVGASGAGKSTVALELGRILGLPLYHLDALYWRPGWIRAPNEAWAELQWRLVSEPEWIIDGNYNSTLDIRLNAADTVIFLNYSRLQCVAGVVRRYLGHYFGRSRVDEIPGCPERLDLEFLRWVWNYRRKNVPRMLRILKELPPTTDVYVFENRRQLRRFTAGLEPRAEGHFGKPYRP
jgi:adenylate kinase family enzyme